MPRPKKTEVSEAVLAAEGKVKTPPTEEIILQYGDADWNIADLKEKAISAYVAEGHRRGRISKLVLYVKPEENKVYYVINDKNTGSADFD